MIDIFRSSIFLAIIIVVTCNVQYDPWQFHRVGELQQELHKAAEYMKNEAHHENVAVCVGTTKSGKSTLINYLIGNKLIGEKVKITGPVTLRKADESPGPQIGNKTASETIHPTRWNSTQFPGMGLWDAPGFDDNRGPVQDITNAFYIHQLFQNVKSLKIVLVTDINDILSDNIKPFLSLLRAVENLLKGRMIYSFDSIAVIFTKVPADLEGIPFDMSLLKILLAEKFSSSSEIDISKSSRDFIQYLIRSDEHVGLFMRAQIGPVTPAIDVGILKAVQKAKPLEEQILKNVSPSISEKSKVFLFKVREKLSSMKEFEELQKILNDVLDGKFKGFGTMDSLDDVSKDYLNVVLEGLKIIRNQTNESLGPTMSLHDRITILREMDPVIERFITERSLLEKSHLLEFIDKLLNLKESNVFDSGIQTVLRSATSKVEESIISVNVKLGNITGREARLKLEKERNELMNDLKSLSEEIARLKKENEESKSFWNKIAKTFLGALATVGITAFLG